MAKVPSAYEHADKLGADGRAALAGARLVWDGLPKSARTLLASVGNGRGYGSGRKRDRDRLAAEGVFTANHACITPLGLLVKEAGTRTQIEVDDG